ncbi:hypothetical protein H5P28_03495 [Ruficoccus amylovorans]|uniref:Uncharacterized protein n=1 Tax=Ruficoccus amylovorans TaxID=1804625 RepID=A0A842HB10_9BACT|nr:hypothetical protein [Ruficoccus amylovorans]MBC2593319.1 hypothetical protein [Ruficoccus amylovorans]
MFKRAQLIALFSLLMAGSAVSRAQDAAVEQGSADAPAKAVAERPLFVENSIYPTGRTTVFGVAQTSVTDVVILNNGLDQGFRLGMVCQVSRSGQNVADLILVDVRGNRAAGLILNLESGEAIRSGDGVSIKTINI